MLLQGFPNNMKKLFYTPYVELNSGFKIELSGAMHCAPTCTLEIFLELNCIDISHRTFYITLKL